ncbi:hypothetical protein ACFYW1_22420 [Streptomyces sp. NPDC002669]|uniref:hypothetical protein n=1 Tax=Streptomyces sp. NPDC002669 TaxID=3364658 RepID=UPI00367423B8
MSLLELIAAADGRSLAVSAVACLDRCLPRPADGSEPDPLRPLRAVRADGREWDARLGAARAAMEEQAPADDVAEQVRQALAAAPGDFSAAPLREWADACSLLALEVHRRFDTPGGDPGADGADPLRRCRAGDPDGSGPLVTGELRRQIQILEILTEAAGTAGDGAALRRAVDLSTEGRRVLRAVASRQARGRG